jgi:hypothetical protein
LQIIDATFSIASLSIQQGSEMAITKLGCLLPLTSLMLAACGGGGGGGESSSGVDQKFVPSIEYAWTRSDDSLELNHANSDRLGKAIVADLLQNTDLVGISLDLINPDTGVPDFKDVVGDQSTEPCTNGGSISYLVDVSSRILVQSISHCTIGNYQSDGILKLQITAVNAATKSFSVTYSFDNYGVSVDGAQQAFLNGTLTADLRFVAGNYGWNAVFNTDFESYQPWAKTSYYSDLEYTAFLDREYYNRTWYRSTFDSVSGVIDIVGYGEAALSWNDTDNSVSVQGTGSGIARLVLDTKDYRYAVTGDDGMFYFTSFSVTPEQVNNVVDGNEVSTLFYGLSYSYEAEPDSEIDIDLTDNLYSARFDLFRITPSVVSDNSDAIEMQFENGILTLNGAPDVYTLSAAYTRLGVASDSSEFTVRLTTDTDGDGVANYMDYDDDGDRVADEDDQFPLDRTEWVDSDHDGIGNNADTDDDNDGIADADDLLPTDSRCSAEYDLIGDTCIHDFVDTRNIVLMDKHGTIYIWDSIYGRSEIYRMDSDTGRMMSPLVPGNIAGHTMYYSAAQDRLYFVRLDQMSIFYVDSLDADPEDGSNIHVLSSPTVQGFSVGCGFVMADDVILAGRMLTGTSCNVSVYDLSGSRVWNDDVPINNTPSYGVFNSVEHAIYYRRTESGDYWLKKLELPESMADFSPVWQYQTDYEESIDNSYFSVDDAGVVVDRTGKVFGATGLEYIKTLELSGEIIAADAESVVARLSGNGGFELTLQNLISDESATRTYNGELLGVYVTDTGFKVVYLSGDPQLITVDSLELN